MKDSLFRHSAIEPLYTSSELGQSEMNLYGEDDVPVHPSMLACLGLGATAQRGEIGAHKAKGGEVLWKFHEHVRL